jgi:hypothetical protein
MQQLCCSGWYMHEKSAAPVGSPEQKQMPFCPSMSMAASTVVLLKVVRKLAYDCGRRPADAKVSRYRQR